MRENNPKESNVKKILSLFLTFLKIGTFTFGGGYAMIPLIQREIVQKRKWITDDDILEIAAIAESTPGPIAVNTATFVGYRICKFGGAFFSTLGVVLPSFLIIAVISYVLREFLHIRAVRYAFYGIRAGVLALILKALWTMYRQCPAKVISYTIAALAFISVAFFKINVLFVLPACALIGLISSFAAARRKKR